MQKGYAFTTLKLLFPDHAAARHRGACESLPTGSSAFRDSGPVEIYYLRYFFPSAAGE